ncbi:LysE family translocator, partial [Pseudomonas aeruginosa]
TTPWLFNALQYTGAVYLIWIRIQALRSRGGGTLDRAVGGVPRVGHWSALLQGYLCNQLNPKAPRFFLARFP